MGALGYFTAVRRGHWDEYAGSFFAVLVICVPGLVVAPLLVMLFALKWRLLPVALWASPWHAILPLTALGLYFSGRIARLMREGMLNTMQAEFITTARAKGLSENAVLLKHAFRLAVLPVVSVWVFSRHRLLRCRPEALRYWRRTVRHKALG